MQTKTFTYSKSKQNKLALIFLGLGIVGAAIALYSWLFASSIIIFYLIGGIFLTLIGLAAFLKLMLAPKKENEAAIIISDKGIVANTTPIAKASGLIEWADIEDIQLYEKMLDLKLKTPQKYAERMKNFFVRDTFLKSLKGSVRISFIETSATRNELEQALKPFVAY